MTWLQKYYHKVNPEDRSPGATAFYANLDSISQVAPSITCSIIKEFEDQSRHLKLIASENHCSLAVQHAMGNLLTDKYAEGFAFHRFYAGCDNVDTVEAEAIDEARQLFNADWAYVQPHSGADANLVAFWAILTHKIQSREVEALGKKSVDELTADEYEKVRLIMCQQTVMGLALDSGGHLTHGFRHNVSGKMFRSVTYSVDPETGLLDYTALAAQVAEVKPLILIAGYSAYPRKLNFAKLRDIADSVGAVLMVDMAHFAGLVAGKVFTGEDDPVPFADIVTSTTHKTLRGPRGGFILCKNEYKDVVNRGCPLVLGGPLPHVMAAKVVAFKEANTPEFRLYTNQVVDNAAALADELTLQGATVLTGGTDNHIVLFDTRPFDLNGRQAETALNSVKLTVNRNSIPGDPNGAWYTSGIRLGSPAMTTRGMTTDNMRTIGRLIAETLQGTKATSKANVEIAPDVLDKVTSAVEDLTLAHPLYPELRIED